MVFLWSLKICISNSEMHTFRAFSSYSEFHCDQEESGPALETISLPAESLSIK